MPSLGNSSCCKMVTTYSSTPKLEKHENNSWIQNKSWSSNTYNIDLAKLTYVGLTILFQRLECELFLICYFGWTLIHVRIFLEKLWKNNDFVNYKN